MSTPPLPRRRAASRAASRDEGYALGWCNGCDWPADKPAGSQFCDDCAGSFPLLGHATSRLRRSPAGRGW